MRYAILGESNKILINQLKTNIKTKICIIGSGIGGGAFAQKLFEQDKSFVIIEAGEFDQNSPNVNYENVGLKFGVRTTTTIQIGGTSNLWHGVLSPMDEIDFKTRSWIPHSGWPISRDDLTIYYKQATKILQLENFDYFDEKKLDKNLLKQLKDLIFNKDYLKNKLFQQPVPPTNFKNIIKKICDKSEKYNCYYNAPALELIYEDSKITRLKVGNKDGGFSYVEAEQFILAAGALETPRLLLNSKMNNPNIGKYLMDHPMGNLCQIKFLKRAKYPIYSDIKYNQNTKIKSGFELKDEMQKKLKLPNHNFFLRPSFVKGINNESEKIKLSLATFKDGGVTLKDCLKVLMSPNIIFQILTYKFSLNVTYKYADLFFVTEQLPNPESKVTLSNNVDKWGYPISKVNWQILPEDIQGIKDWFKLLLTELFPKEHYKFTHNLNDFNWEENFTSAIHHVGTARMGASNQTGVIDKNLKVFDYDNLYVCDGSIFATAGNVNNGLTICAFACRLAKHLETNL